MYICWLITLFSVRLLRGVVVVDVLGDVDGTDIDGGSGGQQVVLVDSTHGVTGDDNKSEN